MFLCRSHSDRDYEETASEEQQDQGDGESILEGIEEERIEEEQRIEEEEEDIHQRNHIGIIYKTFFEKDVLVLINEKGIY